MYRQKAKFMCKPNLVKIIPKGYELKTLILNSKKKIKEIKLTKNSELNLKRQRRKYQSNADRDVRTIIPLVDINNLHN